MVLSPSQMSTSLNEEYFSNNPKLLELVKEHNSYVWGNRANAHLSLITQLQMNKAIPEFYAQEELHAILNKCFDIEKKAALEKFGLFTQQELSWRKLFWHDLKPDLKKFGNIFAIASVLSLPIIGSYYGLLVLSKVILGANVFCGIAFLWHGFGNKFSNFSSIGGYYCCDISFIKCYFII